MATASDSAFGVRAMHETCPDMVLLDEEMPPVNGEELCSYISRIFDIPIIVLVSSEQGEAPARFLEMGADACLAKPPNQRMLLARVNSVFRRYRRDCDHTSLGGVELDTEKHQVNVGDRTIDLTPTEFRLLNCLALNSKRLVPYSELAIAVWGREKISSNCIKFYAHSLRRKLGNNGRRPFELLNGRGVGFRFVKQKTEVINHERY